MTQKPIQNEEPEPSFQGDEIVLTFLFGVLLAGVLGVLFLDFRALTGAQVPLDVPFLRRTEALPPIRPPRENDQVRRYSPQTRVEFGSGGRAKLPGVPGRADNLLSGSMTFHRAPNGVATAIGLIEPGTSFQFEEFLTGQGQDTRIRTLYLHSPGGSVQDAIDMARLVRQLEIATVITKHGYCASSCPLVFSGGVKRSIADPAVLGVHQVFTSDTAIGTLQQGIANAQSISADAQTLLVDMGVNPRAWIEAMATPKDKLYLFTRKEIEELNWVSR